MNVHLLLNSPEGKHMSKDGLVLNKIWLMHFSLNQLGINASLFLYANLKDL